MCACRGRLWSCDRAGPPPIRRPSSIRCLVSSVPFAGCARGCLLALAALDRVIERWEIDRADVRAVTGGSDDGFLYARGFTVAMGREFHGSVAGDPHMGVPWAECEEMCYFLAQLHHERFGAFPAGPASPVSRARTWPAGWASRRAALAHRSRTGLPARHACMQASRVW